VKATLEKSGMRVMALKRMLPPEETA
jgi:hypothetical protein